MDSRSIARPIGVALLALVAVSASAVTEAKLTDAGGGPDDRLGSSAAIDGSYAIAGAPYDATVGTEAGKAVLFFFDGTTWVQQADLFPTIAPAYGYFGASVDIDGDLAVVGAPHSLLPRSVAGFVYVFRRSGSSWGLEDVLIPPDGDLDDEFGSDVAVDGNTIAVGARRHDTSAIDDGAVYVYIRSPSSWTFQQKLIASFGQHSQFGLRVDLWGDWIAATTLNPSYVHTFVRSGGAWITHQFFKGADVLPFDNFGADLALHDQRVLAGNNLHEHPPSSGAAYLFERNAIAGTWPQKKEFLEVSNGAPPDNLGFAVGLGADLAAVGAVLGDGIATATGVVYAYRLANDGGWYEVAKLAASDGAGGQHFGASLGVSGDCIISGAPQDDDHGAYSGSAYVYCGVPDVYVPAKIDIICCVQLPYPFTDPVEFELHFANDSEQTQTIRRWVDLHRPGGGVERVVAEAEFDLERGAEHSERHQVSLSAADPPGDYALVMSWVQGGIPYDDVATFSAVSAAVPGIAPLGLWGLVGAVLAIAVLGLRRRNGASAPR